MHLVITMGGIAVLAVAAIVWGGRVFNRLLMLRTLKEEGWGALGEKLARRHDLIDHLANAVKEPMRDERDAVDELARLRALARQASGVAAVAAAESGLEQGLGRLFGAMENYPQIKTNKNIADLLKSLKALEEEIHLTRRYYNATVRDLNIAIQSFPSIIIARGFGFRESDLLELHPVAFRAAAPS